MIGTRESERVYDPPSHPIAGRLRAGYPTRRSGTLDEINIQIHHADLSGGFDDAAQFRIDRDQPRAGVFKVDPDVARVAVLVSDAPPAAELD